MVSFRVGRGGTINCTITVVQIRLTRVLGVANTCPCDPGSAPGGRAGLLGRILTGDRPIDRRPTCRSTARPYREYAAAIYELAEADLPVHPGANRRLAGGLPTVGLGDGPPHGRRRARGDRRRDHAHRIWYASGRGRGAPAPTGRALPHRGAGTSLGEGARRGGGVGARHLRSGREGDVGQAGRPQDLSARQPDPGSRLPGAGGRAPGPAWRGPGGGARAHLRGTGTRRRDHGLPRRERPASGRPGRDGGPHPDGTITVRVDDDHQVGLGPFIAERVFVVR
jgi:hypothetical protein